MVFESFLGTKTGEECFAENQDKKEFIAEMREKAQIEEGNIKYEE